MSVFEVQFSGERNFLIVSQKVHYTKMPIMCACVSVCNELATTRINLASHPYEMGKSSTGLLGCGWGGRIYLCWVPEDTG